MSESVLTTEELALTFSLLGQPEAGRGLMVTQLGEMSEAEARARLMAAGHSLLARGWMVLGSEGPVLNEELATAVPAATLAGAAVVPPLSERDQLALKLQIPRLLPQWERERQAIGQDLAQTDADLADLERRIRDLQTRRDALQEQARRWPDRVLPDTTRPDLGFDDGLIDAPWRTRSDALEDQIADYDRQIQSLREEEARLLRRRDELRARLDELSRQIEQARKMEPPAALYVIPRNARPITPAEFKRLKSAGQI